MVLYGCCAPGPAGAIFPIASRRLLPATGSFSHWVKTGTLRNILETLARDLEQRGGIDLEECFIDGTFVVAKKGGAVLERPSGARVRSSWLLLTLLVYHSVCTRLLLHLMKSPLSKLRSMQLSPWDDPEELSGIVPMTLIRSMQRLREKGIELIAPHRRGRKKRVTQDGRALRRYQRRWKVERFFAWLNKYKRVITRYDRDIDHYNGFVYLAAALILLKRYL